MFSWDTSTNAPDEDETDGRSYISAVSEIITDGGQTCDGRAKKDMGEARMDIEDSEMGYLGYHDSESYGLTWKVGPWEISALFDALQKILGGLLEQTSGPCCPADCR